MMRRPRKLSLLRTSACALVAALAFACGDGGEGSDSGSGAPAGGSTTGGSTPTQPADPAPTPAPTPTPGPAADACAPPEGSLVGDAALGAPIYAQYCNLCHGPEAAPMQPPPADHADCGYMSALTNEHLYKVICGGGTAVGKSAAMPAWRDIVPQADIRNLIGHLRSICPAS